MIDRESLNAGAMRGASLGTRVDLVSEASLSPWRLAESGGTADYRPLENGHLGNPGSNDRKSAESQPCRCQPSSSGECGLRNTSHNVSSRLVQKSDTLGSRHASAPGAPAILGSR